MASSKELTPRAAIRAEEYKAASGFMDSVGIGEMLEAEYNVEDSFSKLVGGVVKVISIQKAKISCILTVKPSILSGHGVLIGAIVAAVAERVAIGCGRTIIGEDGRDLGLGEISISYLSSAPPNAEVVVDASVISSGKKQTVVAVEFRLKESGRLAYVTRATLHRMPLSNL